MDPCKLFNEIRAQALVLVALSGAREGISHRHSDEAADPDFLAKAEGVVNERMADEASILALFLDEAEKIGLLNALARAAAEFAEVNIAPDGDGDGEAR